MFLEIEHEESGTKHLLNLEAAALFSPHPENPKKSLMYMPNGLRELDFTYEEIRAALADEGAILNDAGEDAGGEESAKP
jgi:hypothetical protein